MGRQFPFSSFQIFYSYSDRMLFCTKYSLCSMRFHKTFMLGNVKVQANLVQSLTITMHRIREVSSKISKIKELIGADDIRAIKVV